MTCPACLHPTPPHALTCPLCAAPLTANAHHLPRGSRLLGGRYSVGRALGEGGFGITYGGADVQLKRPVAIKELFPQGSARTGSTLRPPPTLGAQGFAEAKTRFLQEASTLAKFNHEGIVRVLDVFEGNSSAYMVMEFLKGETLGAKLQRLGKLEPDEVMKLADRLLVALELVHDAGILHRDIKPDNILLTEDGRTVLIDFGSARLFQRDKTLAMTQVLTPGYAAPEQYQTKGRFGAYTDLYSLAATLYHCLTSVMPSAATDRLMGEVLPRLPDNVPNPTNVALQKALMLHVIDRPQTVAQMLKMLNDKPAANNNSVQSSKRGNKPNRATTKELEAFLDELDPRIAEVVMRLEGMRHYEKRSEVVVTKELQMSIDEVKAAYKRGMFKLRMAYGRSRNNIPMG